MNFDEAVKLILGVWAVLVLTGIGMKAAGAVIEWFKPTKK